MAATVQERVARGAKLLDACKPNWFDCVDLNDLDMANCHMCILGQLWGLYAVGLRSLVRYKGVRPSNPEKPTAYRMSQRHGFMATIGDDANFSLPVYWPEFNALAEAWRAEIRKRTGGGNGDADGASG